MHKLWPPTYDNLSVRLWAAAISVVVILFLWLLVKTTDSDTVFWFFAFPGMFPAMIVTGITHGDIEGSLTPLAFMAWLLTEFAFYYSIAWVFISAFRPATNWWPEKRA